MLNINKTLEGEKAVFELEGRLDTVTAPELDGSSFPALILWGDGSYELYEEGLVHQYGQGGAHTVRIEALSLPFFLIPPLEDGMRLDFSKVRGKGQ